MLTLMASRAPRQRRFVLSSRKACRPELLPSRGRTLSLSSTMRIWTPNGMPDVKAMLHACAFYTYGWGCEHDAVTGFDIDNSLLDDA